jgi:predicted CXXCH cytochrome family protein
LALAPPAKSAEAADARPTTEVQTCTDGGCHASIVDRKVMHGPTAQQKCLACHQYKEPRDHSFRLASDPQKLCSDCHTLNHRTYTHAPVEQGRCTGCHDPHGSDFRASLVADPTRGLCLTCHQQDFSQKKFVHGPVASGTCILCHEAHSSWQPKLLSSAPDKMCLGCHAELVPKPGEARHVHAPAKDKCTSCHDAHASDLKYQLREAAPALCLSCHKELAEKIAAAPVVHGAVKGPDGCSGCHTPHFSQLPKLQRQAQPQACLSCHDRAIQLADGTTLTDIAALLKDNPQQHGPIREGACTACHQPHASEHYRLLTADYPPDFYAAFDLGKYKLCFSCHIPDLVLKQRGGGLTRFREGDLNLHWVHVNQQKGRTCRACHEVHASKHPFHIRDAVPFGTSGWMLEIGYEQTPTGGSCAPGCHKPRTYNNGDQAAASPTTQEVRP